MNGTSTSENLIIREFTASKQLKLFTSLQQAQISGQLTFTNPQHGYQWHFHLYLGEILYATGGVHPIRRWQRNLVTNLPQIKFNLSSLQRELTAIATDPYYQEPNSNLWEYEQLAAWKQKNIITAQQAKKAILMVLLEMLFDITQGREVVCNINRDKIISPLLKAIKPEEFIPETARLWQEWRGEKIADRSPNLAPIILQPKQLQEKTSISAYQSLCKLLNGNRTLRDLAVQLQTSTLQVTYSLLPYIQSGIFNLIEVPDLLELITPENPDDTVDRDRPLIACIDDSMMISHLMEQIMSMAGYRFVAINDPLKAITILLDGFDLFRRSNAQN